jgi:hypothetical protein
MSGLRFRTEGAEEAEGMPEGEDGPADEEDGPATAGEGMEWERDRPNEEAEWEEDGFEREAAGRWNFRGGLVSLIGLPSLSRGVGATVTGPAKPKGLTRSPEAKVASARKASAAEYVPKKSQREA